MTDFTEHPTLTGKLYLASLKDVFSNRIVGYALSPRPTADLACAALRHAIVRRNPAGTVVVHSDRGGPTGLNRWKQHLPIAESVGVHRVPRREFANRGSFEVAC